MGSGEVFETSYRGSALYSPDKTYRYTLSRHLGGLESSGHALWIMLNPSTATAEHDDATIRRCIDFAKRWGRAWLYVGNLSPLRATDAQVLKQAGPEPQEIWDANIQHILEMAKQSDRVVVAWGTQGVWENRDRRMMEVLDKEGISVECLGRSKGGQPLHPCRLAKSRGREPFRLEDVL